MNRSTPSAFVFVGAMLAAVACTRSSDPEESSSEEDLRATKACQNKSCGDSCSLCGGQPGCVETAVLKFCNADGRCTQQQPVCGGAPQGDGSTYDPCANKACGESCRLCPPNQPDCVETAVLKACDAEGKCTAGVPACSGDGGGGTYEPCDGKPCGASCTVCPPGDPDCIETGVVKHCQPDGSCKGTPAACR